MRNSELVWCRFVISQKSMFKAPPEEWIEEMMATMQKTLEQRTQRSALLLRNLLGNICLEPTRVNIGRPYSPATSQLYVIALLEDDPENPEPGSKSFLIRFLSPSAKDWHLKLAQNRNAFTQEGGSIRPFDPRVRV